MALQRNEDTNALPFPFKNILLVPNTLWKNRQLSLLPYVTFGCLVFTVIFIAVTFWLVFLHCNNFILWQICENAVVVCWRSSTRKSTQSCPSLFLWYKGNHCLICTNNTLKRHPFLWNNLWYKKVDCRAYLVFYVLFVPITKLGRYELW